MSFLDHLEELRWHLIRAVLAVFVCTIVVFASKEIVFHHIILGPSRTDFWTYRQLCALAQQIGSQALCMDTLPFTIQSRTMTGQFSMHISSSIVIGLIVAFPYVFWEIWRFIKPGLYETEQAVTTGAVFFVSLLFGTGVLFGYYIVSPLAVNFLSNYQVDATILNEFDITSYINTLTMVVLSCAIMFQLPMVIYVLSKAGLVTPVLLRTYRRHAIVSILVVSAVITPPDMITQVLISLPIFVLYEISIFISGVVQRRRLRTLAARADTRVLAPDANS